MSHRERGAAQVSVMWVIFLLVLLFGVGAFLYATLSDMKLVEDEVTAKLESTNETLTDTRSELMQHRDSSTSATSASFTGADTGVDRPVTRRRGDEEPASRPCARTTRTSSARATTRSKRSSTSSSATAMRCPASSPPARRSWFPRTTLVRLPRTRTREVETERDTARSELEDEKDAEIASLRNQQGIDQGQISDLENRLSEADARERALKEDYDAQIASLQKDIQTLEGRVAEQGRKLEVLRNPEEPDGEVLRVDNNLGIAYIDIGREDLLRRGTRFAVFRYGKGGVRQATGVVEVRKLYDDMAEVGVIETYDALDPIAPGDQIAAPLYSRDMQREFVLIGRFPAGYPRDTSRGYRLRSPRCWCRRHRDGEHGLPGGGPSRRSVQRRGHRRPAAVG